MQRILFFACMCACSFAFVATASAQEPLPTTMRFETAPSTAAKPSKTKSVTRTQERVLKAASAPGQSPVRRDGAATPVASATVPSAGKLLPTTSKVYPAPKHTQEPPNMK